MPDDGRLQIRKPDDATLAFLLGLALGVMATLSLVELWIKNAAVHGFVMITVSLAAGFLLYYVAQPFFPEFEVRPAIARCVLWGSCGPALQISLR